MMWLGHMLVIFSTLFPTQEIIAMTVHVLKSKEAILGPSDLQLKCEFTKDAGEIIFGGNFQAKIDNIVKDITSFQPNSNGLDPFFLSPAGDFLLSRTHLSNPTTFLPNTATITFNTVECIDEKEYSCRIIYRSSSGQYRIMTSDSIYLTVKGVPESPNNEPTWAPSLGIEAGTNVTFTCYSNVGKPAGRIIWTKYNSITETMYNSTTTTLAVIQNSCTYNTTSTLTLMMKPEDNHAVIRCSVEQELATADMYIESQAEDLAVYYNIRNLQIAKQPDLPSYSENESAITLICFAEGNPEPIFRWYRQEDMNTVLTLGNTYTISQGDVVVSNKGAYVCVGSNVVSGNQYNISATDYIDIESIPDSSIASYLNNSDLAMYSTMAEDSETSWVPIIVGSVASFILLILAVLTVFVLYKEGKLMRKLKGKIYPEKKTTLSEEYFYRSSKFMKQPKRCSNIS